MNEHAARFLLRPREKGESLPAFKARVYEFYEYFDDKRLRNPKTLRSFADVDGVRRTLLLKVNRFAANAHADIRGLIANETQNTRRRELDAAVGEIPAGALDEYLEELLAQEYVEAPAASRAQKWVCGRCVLEGGRMRPKRRAVKRRPRRV